MTYISEKRTTAPENITNPTEKKVFALLDKLKIAYECVENDVVESMEECKEVDEALGTEIRKSIFLLLQRYCAAIGFKDLSNHMLHLIPPGKKNGL